MDDDWDPRVELSRWDRLLVRWDVFRWRVTHRYCTACDVLYRPWDRGHRSCRCGLSRPDEWDQDTRDALQTVIQAAVRAAEGEDHG